MATTVGLMGLNDEAEAPAYRTLEARALGPEHVLVFPWGTLSLVAVGGDGESVTLYFYNLMRELTSLRVASDLPFKVAI